MPSFEFTKKNIIIAVVIIIVIIWIFRHIRATSKLARPKPEPAPEPAPEPEPIPTDGFYLTSLDNPNVRFPATGYVRVTFGPKRDTYMLYPYATANPSESPYPWMIDERGAIMAEMTRGCFLLTLINPSGLKWIIYGAPDNVMRTCAFECCDQLASSRWLMHKSA